MADLDGIKEDVWCKLSLLNVIELGELCTGLDLKLEPSKKPKKSALYTMIMSMLTSSDVEGMEEEKDLELFQNVKRTVDSLFSTYAAKIMGFLHRR